jgi:hypothetical protein
MTTKKSTVARPKGAQVKKSAPRITVRVAASDGVRLTLSANLAKRNSSVNWRSAGHAWSRCRVFIMGRRRRRGEGARGRRPDADVSSRMAKHKIWLIGGSVPWNRRGEQGAQQLPGVRRRGKLVARSTRSICLASTSATNAIKKPS